MKIKQQIIENRENGSQYWDIKISHKFQLKNPLTNNQIEKLKRILRIITNETRP